MSRPERPPPADLRPSVADFILTIAVAFAAGFCVYALGVITGARFFAPGCGL